ncbi:MAG: GumC family protein [Hyphomicrobiales bacterium]|nr:GumC family protein [Hyphomicrobiales bacterium]
MPARLQTPPGPIQFDIWAIATILRRRFGIVLLTAVLLAGATAAYTLTVHPIYRASARMLIDPSTRQPFDNPNVIARGIDDGTFVDSHVAVIASDTTLRPVVQQFDLTNDPEFGEHAASGLVSSVLSLLRGSDVSRDPASEARRENDAVEALGKAVAVKREGLTFVVDILVDSDNPDKAAKLAQAIAESYLEDRKRQNEASSAEVGEQIQQRLVGLRERLNDAELAVQRFKAEHQLQSTGQDGLLKSQELGGLSAQLTEARAELAEKQARYDEIAAFLKKGVNLNSINELSASANGARLREQYTLAARTVASLEAGLLPRHPQLIRAKSDVARLEGLLRADAQDTANAAKIELGVARERVANLEAAVDTSRAVTVTGDSALVGLRALETEAQATRTLYENALAKTKEISELDQVVVPGARIISPGLPSDIPVWPKKKLLVALGGILGLVLGVALVVGREAMRQVSQQFGQRFAAPGAMSVVAPHDAAAPEKSVETRSQGESELPGSAEHVELAPANDEPPKRVVGLSLLNMAQRGQERPKRVAGGSLLNM